LALVLIIEGLLYRDSHGVGAGPDYRGLAAVYVAAKISGPGGGNFATGRQSNSDDRPDRHDGWAADSIPRPRLESRNTMGKNVVVIGTQWGDEGKGKIVDLLTERASAVARFQGGHNAGHTLVIDGVNWMRWSLKPMH